MATTKSEIFDRVLQDERQRNVRYLNGARFAAVSLFLTLRLGVDHLLQHANERPFPWILVGYWLISGALFAEGRRSPRVARLSAVAVPFFDIPVVLATGCRQYRTREFAAVQRPMKFENWRIYVNAHADAANPHPTNQLYVVSAVAWTAPGDTISPESQLV